MESLSNLVQQNNHLGVLRYIRTHQLREPRLVVDHGRLLLGSDLSAGSFGTGSAEVKFGILEQICLAALDVANHELAELCLARLKTNRQVVDPTSTRFRRLLARCLEASGDYDKALAIYDDFLKENPANLVALERKYCIARAKDEEPEIVVAALNEYLGQNMADVSGWWEMSRLRMSLGDFKQAAYALEQVVLGSPLEPDVHRQLAEVYATVGGLENLALARKHMAQSLELDASNVRAQLGIVAISNQYLEEATSNKTKHVGSIDGHELDVARELVQYGATRVLDMYREKSMFQAVKRVMEDYTENIA